MVALTREETKMTIEKFKEVMMAINNTVSTVIV